MFLLNLILRIIMKFSFLLSLGIAASISSISAQRTDIFQNKTDVGNPKNLGSYVYNTVNQSYIVRGSGYNIWFDRDEFHYMYNKIKGDFILTANFEFIGKGANPHRKTGFMVRESTNEKAAHISAVMHGNGLTVMQWRETAGASMRDPQDEIFASDSAYNILQIERAGNKFIMRAAHSGEPLEEIGTHVMDNLPGEVLAGMFICSHDPGVIEEARVWNLRIDKPVSDDYNPGEKGYLGCRLETMNVENGMRHLILEKPGRFEAPNWMPDGKKLLFNMMVFYI
jgi:TolB protein